MRTYLWYELAKRECDRLKIIRELAEHEKYVQSLQLPVSKGGKSQLF